MTEESLFDLLIRTPEAERAVLLDRACVGKPEMRARIKALMTADAGSSPLSKPSPKLDATRGYECTASYNSPDASAGILIAGRYTLDQKLGEGGMGEVWVAKQSEPVKRKVALKLIKPGMDSKSVIQRFEQERQALALMDHPNIAKVLDGGLHNHRPFFVMELVKGYPITDYCDTKKLNPKERLELFVSVCQAIQHAHQKGIIHRDIKPSNVLVAMYDDKPVVKVIDFGVAKATGGTLTEATIDTGIGNIVGTPQYMSPEQATFNNLDIDTRSDVYALGVLLYELLTGSTPFSSDELKQRGLLEMLRVVREEEPPRPSTRLSTAEALPTLSANRGTEPKKLTGLLRNELDWIVMKALDKDRTRRYETANGFAADVMRYLSGEPVIAHPPSLWYRYRKFSRRHRGGILTTYGLIICLAFFIGGLYWQVDRARKAERLAEEARDREALRADGEQKAKQNAQLRLRQIEKSNEILSSIFDDLNLHKEQKTSEPVEATLAKRLIKAGEQLDGEVIGDPLIVADMQARLGIALHHLGFFKEAIVLYEKSWKTNSSLLGTGHRKTLTSLNNLAMAYIDDGQNEKALPMLEENLRLTRGFFEATKPDYVEILDSISNLGMSYLKAGLYSKALPLTEEAYLLTKAKLGATNSRTLASMGNLSANYSFLGQFDKALSLQLEVWKISKATLGDDHPDTLISMNNVAASYSEVGQFQKAVETWREVLRMRRKRLGEQHPDTLMTMTELGNAYHLIDDETHALPLLQEAVRLQIEKVGEDHPDTLNTINRLAVTYQAIKQLDKALPLFEETLQKRKKILRHDHPDIMTSIDNLAHAYQAAKQFDKAIPMLEENLALRITKLGEVHPQTLKCMNNLAAAYWNAKQLNKSIPIFEALRPLQEKEMGHDHPNTLATLGNLGVNYIDAGRLLEGLPLLEQCYRASSKHPSLRPFGRPLLDAYVKAGNKDRAVAIVHDLVEETRKKYPPENPNLTVQLNVLSVTLNQVKAFEESEKLLRECLAIREKTQPDEWITFNTISMLGGALMGQKKYTDAEPLLLKGYEGMKQREKNIPDNGKLRLTQALDRLIQLYTETNKPEEVKKWQAEKDKLPKVTMK